VEASDGELVLALRRGDRGALEQLVRRYHAPLRSCLYHQVRGDVHLAEDLVQEVFVTVISKAGQLRDPEAFKTWVYRIASNKARDYFKSCQGRAVPIEGPGQGTARASPAEQPEEKTVWEHQRVREALERLSPHHREVLVLRYYQELALSEIATVLKLPQGTVKSRLHYAMKYLREQLVRDEVMPGGQFKPRQAP